MSCAAERLHPDYYLQLYPDLRAAFGTDRTAAENHFREHGRHEGRSPNPFFIAEYYFATYPKVKDGCGGDSGKALDHWLTFGMDEGRRGSPIFDPHFYLATYLDVAAVYGAKNYRGAYDHFVGFGIKEGRVSAPDAPPLFDQHGKLMAGPIIDALFSVGSEAGVVQKGVGSIPDLTALLSAARELPPPPANPFDIVTSGNRTGEGSLFFNKVKLAAQQKITEANNDRAAALAAEHAKAEATLREAHGKAIDTLGQNLEKVYMRIGYDSGIDWIATDAKGSSIRSPDFASFKGSANFKITLDVTWNWIAGGSGAILFINPKNQLGYADFNGFVFSKVDLGIAPGDKPGGRIALDGEEGVAFSILSTAHEADREGTGWVPRAAALVKTNLANRSTTRIADLSSKGLLDTALWSMALDTTTREIYWCDGYRFGVVSYDGSANTFLIEEWWVRSELLAVDSEHGCFYSCAGGEVLRRRRDDLTRVVVLPQQYGVYAAAIDLATQLIYWIANENEDGKLYARLYRAPLGSPNARGNYDARAHQRLVFSVPVRAEITDMVLLTSTDEISQRLAAATFKKNQAHIVASQNIAKAHADATTKRDQAHANLADAHAKAESDISLKQADAAKIRDNAQAYAHARRDEAVQLVRDKRAKADQDRADANAAAQSLIDKKKASVETQKDAERARLDAQRRARQNS